MREYEKSFERSMKAEEKIQINSFEKVLKRVKTLLAEEQKEPKDVSSQFSLFGSTNSFKETKLLNYFKPYRKYFYSKKKLFIFYLFIFFYLIYFFLFFFFIFYFSF